VPALIETKPFTIHPELYAWPSFRIFSERSVLAYLALAIVLTVLLVFGMNLSIPLAILTALGLVLAAFGLTFMRYRAYLRKPANRQLFENCIVSLDEQRVRQDFPNGSFMEIQFFAIKSFRDIGDFYFIFATRRNGIVVAKTAFESPDESKEFAARVRGAMGKK
jgi:hypothetical protein